MSALKEIRELLVDFYNYDGVISGEKFVLLYDEINLSALLLESELSLFAIYVMPNFRTRHSSYGW